MTPRTWFRRAKPRSRLTNVLYTLLQTACMWGIFLIAIPAAVVVAERMIGVPRHDWAAARPVAMTLFCLAGSIGIACGLSFALLGKGTPLPLDTTTQLVIVGPYRHVRNPMAVLGILQGVMVGVYLGSVGVIVYALAGIVVWHVFARPQEEDDLEARFGEAYRAYRQDVPLWIPKLKPHRRVVQGEHESLEAEPTEGSVTSSG